MVNDPTLERENVGGNEPMGDPAETDPLTRSNPDIERDPDAQPDEELSEGAGREQTPV
ncbi:MAG TPA: hypothetical protein VIT43_07300 [Candidatus Dormibacteraeota bacterium]